MAARMGDPTSHGGAIVSGNPTVLIEGKPAATLGDQHVCPMCTPGTPPVPHVGGPITMGTPTVLIGGKPAARMGDVCTCVGPPATVLMGAPTVLIGTSGGGGGGGAGGGAAAAAAASAALGAQALGTTIEPVDHWAAVFYRDARGRPVRGVTFESVGSDAHAASGTLASAGGVWWDGLSAQGTCEASLVAIVSLEWSVEKAASGDDVRVQARVAGVEDGTPAVFRIMRVGERSEAVVAEAVVEVSGSQAEMAWTVEAPVEQEGVRELAPDDRIAAPLRVYVCAVACLGAYAAGPRLPVQDVVDLEVRTSQGDPLSGASVRFAGADAGVIDRALDGAGVTGEQDVPEEWVRVSFPDPTPASDPDRS